MQHATSDIFIAAKEPRSPGTHSSISSPIQICDFRYWPFAYEFAG